ncbi:hypothetical protein N7E02_04750 (plasmid) [Aliirhizobium terrae]|uniref:hypothetical protein n=1 Tax=Terrirhizobium terrae TaxID=2926709 RepID=UPI0025777539|nr:hypothetical protein [Rhizobium sp. CC-CFT758]WJH38689.1 hypothetical protein N7E02_04750 [Rhizobium sp. CC-CFT758]
MTSIAGDLRLKLEQLVDHYVTSGSKAPDVIAAMETELQDMRRAYHEDPDPADEPSEIEEPANDWPAAT